MPFFYICCLWSDELKSCIIEAVDPKSLIEESQTT